MRNAAGGALVVLAGVTCATAPLPPGPQPKVDLLFHAGSGRPLLDEQPVLDVLATADQDLDGAPELDLLVIFGGRFYYADKRRQEVVALRLDGPATPARVGNPGPAAHLTADTDGTLFTVTDDCAIRRGDGRNLGACRGNPRTIDVDATHVYVFTEVMKAGEPTGSTTLLFRVSKSGGARAQLVADIGGVVWNVFAGDRPMQGADAFYLTRMVDIVRCPKDGGMPTLLANAPPDRIFHGPRLVDQGSVYFGMDWFDGSKATTGPYLVRVPERGGEPVAIDEGIGALAVVGDRLYAATEETLFEAPRSGGLWRRVATLPRGAWSLHPWAGKLYALDRDMLVRIDPGGPRARQLVERDDHDGVIASLALAGDRLYYATAAAGGHVLWSIAKTGGQPVQLLAGETFLSAPAIDGERAYFIGGNGGLRAFPLAGGPTAALSPPSPAPRKPGFDLESSETLLPELVAADDSAVYWIDVAKGALLQVSKRSGQPRPLAQIGGTPRRLALDGRYVYVSALEGATVRLGRIPKSAGPVEWLATSDDHDPVDSLLWMRVSSGRRPERCSRCRRRRPRIESRSPWAASRRRSILRRGATRKSPTSPCEGIPRSTPSPTPRAHRWSAIHAPTERSASWASGRPARRGCAPTTTPSTSWMPASPSSRRGCP